MNSQTPKPRPWVAVAITAVLCGIAIHSQLTTGKVGDVLVGALVVLACFWAGRSVEVEMFERWFRR